jgi:serine/threonine-protein kinase HipA
VPRDQLFLWWLAQPAQPWLIGELNLVRSTRGVSLRYSASWIERGFPLSEDLPLIAEQESLPTENDTAATTVDDARPDRWGERVIRFLDKPARLSLLEYLYFAGDDRDRYAPDRACVDDARGQGWDPSGANVARAAHRRARRCHPPFRP